MATHEDLNKIEEIGRDKLSSDGLSQEGIQVEPDKAQFDALMQQSKNAHEAAVIAKDSTTKPNLLEEVGRANRRVNSTSKSSAKDLLAQAEGAVKNIESIKETLATQQPINSAYHNLLRNKLTHIDDNLKIALSKAGVEYTTPDQKTGMVNPIERFLGNLSHAQFQLENLGTYLEGISNNKGQLSPANMLAIQIKVTHIQQELEFFTSLLNKALESTKTLMNIQV